MQYITTHRRHSLSDAHEYYGTNLFTRVRLFLNATALYYQDKQTQLNIACD